MFQTVCAPADAPANEVPPTLTTVGWEPGSSTASPVFWELSGKQSSDPASPEAASTVCPWAAIWEKMPFSASMSDVPTTCSQLPPLVVTTRALSSLAMRWNRSSAPASSTFGAS